MIDIPLFLLASCSFCLFWVVAGYPIWLSWKARYRGRVPDCAPIEPSITAIIPVHNGGPFLAAKLDSVLSSDYPPAKLEVLVLSDASTDDTDTIAESYGSTGRVRFMRLPRGGKAAALSTAFQNSEREILVLTDVRQALDRNCVRLLVSRFHDPTVGAVSGNLKIRSGETSAEAVVGLYWRYESWIRSNLSLVDSLLGAAGAAYAIRRRLARPLPKACILDDMWLPLQVVLDGKRTLFAEDSVAWDYPTDLKSEFARKVRTQAGLYQLLALEPRLLKPWSNRLWVPFMALKLGRLFLPHLLIALFLITFWLPSPIKLMILIPQLTFYGLSFLDNLIPEGAKAKRLTGPVAAFSTLIAAAFCAQAIFFTDPGKLWKTTRVRITDDRS
jgi:cellulose synthase/poly-beta-1,6-N-acetylglucosamine synthase-like glycosyltransferase